MQSSFNVTAGVTIKPLCSEVLQSYRKLQNVKHLKHGNENGYYLIYKQMQFLHNKFKHHKTLLHLCMYKKSQKNEERKRERQRIDKRNRDCDSNRNI